MAALVGYGIVIMAALGYGGPWLWRGVTKKTRRCQLGGGQVHVRLVTACSGDRSSSSVSVQT